MNSALLCYCVRNKGLEIYRDQGSLDWITCTENTSYLYGFKWTVVSSYKSYIWKVIAVYILTINCNILLNINILKRQTNFALSAAGYLLVIPCFMSPNPPNLHVSCLFGVSLLVRLPKYASCISPKFPPPLAVDTLLQQQNKSKNKEQP